MKFNYICIYILFTFSLCFSSSSNSTLMSNENYITGEDGVVRMYVNIVGHVKNPGTYLVYDGIDIMSGISLAGGYLQGSNLNSIIVHHEDGSSSKINLNNSLNSNSSFDSLVQLQPHDTIFIKQKFFSQIFTSSNIPAVILGILNIALTIERTE